MLGTRRIPFMLISLLTIRGYIELSAFRRSRVMEMHLPFVILAKSKRRLRFRSVAP